MNNAAASFVNAVVAAKQESPSTSSKEVTAEL
jgi:hypothetical protein